MSQTIGNCKATTKSGDPCSLPAGPSGYCHVHNPEKKIEVQAAQEEAARRKEAEHEAEKQRREEQLQQIQEVMLQLESRLQTYAENRRKHHLLESVTEGLYVEIEKLTKKAPAEQVTELALEQINDVIQDTKALLKDDPYIERLNVFVPAGDLPQLRDTLIVLRQVKQGLQRFSRAWNTESLVNKLRLAGIIKSAVEFALAGEDNVSILEKIKAQKSVSSDVAPQLEKLLSELDIRASSTVPSEWQISDGYGRQEAFNLQRLDSIDIAEYFRVE